MERSALTEEVIPPKWRPFETLLTVWTTDGLSGGLELGIPYLYNALVRSRLPTRSGSTRVDYGDVEVSETPRLFDGIVPFAGDRPAHERSLLRGIRRNVTPGDSVVAVGGGHGVSTVACARAVGPNGHVTVFEGAEEWVGKTRETVRLNGVTDRVSVEHAIVTDTENLRGERGEARRRDAGELPDCDALVLDCEGAEMEVLSALTVDPDRIIAETHGCLGAPAGAVERALVDRGYAVVESMPAHGNPFSGDQFVLVGRRRRE